MEVIVAHHAPYLQAVLPTISFRDTHKVKTIKQVLLSGQTYVYTILWKTGLNGIYVNTVRDYPVFIGIRCHVNSSGLQPLYTSQPYLVITYITNTLTLQTETDWAICYSSLYRDLKVDRDASLKVTVILCELKIINSRTLSVNILQNHEKHFSSKEIFSQHQLSLLNEKACLFVNSESSHMKKISVFYRNKRTAYFDHILQTDGIMKPYIKSMTGDPKCPINGRINGLFFMGRTNRYNTSELPPVSPYGEMRFVIPAHRLFDSQKNLYFSDFFCHNKEHHVSVVITVPGSYADKYCQSHLLELPKYENEYLRLSSDGTIWTSHSAWVEVLYTESLNLRFELLFSGAYLMPTKVIGTGDIDRIGRPKRPDCAYCNL